MVLVVVPSMFPFSLLTMAFLRSWLPPVTRILEAKILTTELWNMCDVSKNKRRLSAKLFLSVAPRIPKVQQLKEYFSGKEPSKYVDIYSLTLGIETTGSVFTKLIPRNMSFPLANLRSSPRLLTINRLVIQVFEGDRSLTKDNNLLGKFELSGIPPSPCGIPHIEGTFEINANGIMNIRR